MYLKKYHEFKSVFDNGRRFLTNYFNLFYKKNNLPHLRLGLAVSKRVGSAVKRNQVKRILREAFRKLAKNVNNNIIDGYDIVIVARPSIIEASFNDICNELNIFLSRIS